MIIKLQDKFTLFSCRRMRGCIAWASSYPDERQFQIRNHIQMQLSVQINDLPKIQQLSGCALAQLHGQSTSTLQVKWGEYL